MTRARRLTWEDIYYRHVRAGDDPAYAIYAADEWRKRQEKKRMSVRAKFKVNRIERSLWRDGVEVQTIVLSPVYSSDKDSENAKFYQATPSGEIRLGTVNAAAAAVFDLEAEYYVTFERAQ